MRIPLKLATRARHIQACLKGLSVLFTTAVDAINNLIAGQTTGRLKQELNNKTGADPLFQIISQRYKQVPATITSNRAFEN